MAAGGPIFVVLFLVASTGVDAAGGAAATPVARVNGAVITRAALDDAMRRLAPADQPGRRAETLERLVLIELAHQRAVRAGLEPTGAEVDSAAAARRERLGGESAYRADLAARGVTEDEFKREISREIAVERLYAREVTAKAVVSESWLRAAYEAQAPRFTQAEAIRLVDVLVASAPPGAKAVDKAAELRERIRAEAHQDPWKLVLDGTFVVRNYEPRLPRDAPLVREARRIGVGGLSGVVETADGAHVFKVREYRPASTASFEEARPFLERELQPEAIRRRTREWEDELRQDAQIEIVAEPKP
jgi:peptidyl-prolyl cis-trans isomerase SurA